MEQPVPIEYNGKMYYDVKGFSFMTNRATHTIYRLINQGNSIRKLKTERFLGRPIIPVEELTEFPFTAPGPGGKNNVVHYTSEGKEASDA